jgi:hypothetical protein
MEGSRCGGVQGSLGAVYGLVRYGLPSHNRSGTLEVLSCREALALALDLSVDRVIISCDCKPVILEIKERTDGVYGTIINEIFEGARNFNSCNFFFESRFKRSS